MATFVAGFAVGFMSLWKLALVTLAVVPLIAIAGGFYAACLTEHTARTQQQYWEAGSIVEQVPSASLHIEILDPLISPIENWCGYTLHMVYEVGCTNSSVCMLPSKMQDIIELSSNPT